MLNKIFLTKQFITKKIKEQIIKMYSIPLNEIQGNHFFLHKLLGKKFLSVSNKENPLIFELIERSSYNKSYIKELKKVLESGVPVDIENTEGLTLLEQSLKLYNEGRCEKSNLFDILEVLLPYKKEEIFNINIEFYDEIKEVNNFKENNTFNYYNSIFPKNRDVVTYLLGNENLTDKEKRTISYICLSDLINYSYICNYKMNDYNQGVIEYIESLLDTPYIWKDKYDSFCLLRKIFSSDLDEIINYKSLIICYNVFASLHYLQQKSIIYSIVKRNKETTLFNLLPYGVDLNWEIEKEFGEKTVLGLEMLSSIPMIKMLLGSNKFDITKSNFEGQNILFLLGNSAVENEDIKDLLIKKIQDLDEITKHNFLYKVDKYGRSAMDKAISNCDEVLIEFLCQLGISPFYYILGINRNSLEFLEFLLSIKAEGESKAFYQRYYKKWSSFKLQEKLEKELSEIGKQKSKCVKV